MIVSSPALLTNATVVVGTDAGGPPLVRLIDPATQNLQSQFLAFESTFSGGVRVATGDVNGDGQLDLVVAPGQGGGPVVKVYNGKDGSELSTFYAYDPSFRGGVDVATGDLDGDGKDEVIVGAGVGGGPQVSIFNGVTGVSLGSGFAYDSSLRTGVRVAAGDLDGDGNAEIITGAGAGGGPHVKVFRMGGNTNPLQEVSGFYAFAQSFTGGVNVAAGDLDGNGKAEIITGAGTGGGPQVSIFDIQGTQIGSFNAYAEDFRGGVRVGAAKLTDQPGAVLLTAAGPGGGPQINLYQRPATTPLTNLIGTKPDQRTGFRVAGSAQRIVTPTTTDFVVQDAYDTIAAAILAEQQAQEAARIAAQQAQQQLFQQYFIYAPNIYQSGFGGYGNYGGLGLGLGLGGLGLGGLGFGGLGFGGLGGLGGFGYGPTLFGSNYGSYYDPYYYDPYSYNSGYYGGGYYDPGYYDSGFYDSGFYDSGYYY